MAKRYVTDTSAFAGTPTRPCSCIGGYGYLREYGLEKIVRDPWVHRIPEGPTRSCGWSSRGLSANV